MIKVSSIKQEFNPFDHDNIITKMDKITLKKYVNKFMKYGVLEKNNNSQKIIIHNSSKKNNVIQVSYFNNSIAIADTEKTNIIDAVKEIYGLWMV